MRRVRHEAAVATGSRYHSYRAHRGRLPGRAADRDYVDPRLGTAYPRGPAPFLGEGLPSPERRGDLRGALPLEPQPVLSGQSHYRPGRLRGHQSAVGLPRVPAGVVLGVPTGDPGGRAAPRGALRGSLPSLPAACPAVLADPDSGEGSRRDGAVLVAKSQPGVGIRIRAVASGRGGAVAHPGMRRDSAAPGGGLDGSSFARVRRDRADSGAERAGVGGDSPVPAGVPPCAAPAPALGGARGRAGGFCGRRLEHRLPGDRVGRAAVSPRRSLLRAVVPGADAPEGIVSEPRTDSLGRGGSLPGRRSFGGDPLAGAAGAGVFRRAGDGRDAHGDVPAEGYRLGGR